MDNGGHLYVIVSVGHGNSVAGRGGEGGGRGGDVSGCGEEARGRGQEQECGDHPLWRQHRPGGSQSNNLMKDK